MENFTQTSTHWLLKYMIGFVFVLYSSLAGFCQSVGINTTGVPANASAGLDVDFPNKGLLIPRVALTNTGSFAPLLAHVPGMMLYNTATSGDVIPGFYCDNGSKWSTSLLPGGNAAGDIQYWNGTSWTVLPVGQTGQFLVFTTANIPAWSGGGYPIIITSSPTGITSTTATSGGNILSDGGNAVTARGVCWNIAPNPTTTMLTKTVDGAGTGTFISTITGLTTLTTYYIRSYATNSAGTIYGNQQIFTTP